VGDMRRDNRRMAGMWIVLPTTGAVWPVAGEGDHGDGDGDGGVRRRGDEDDALAEGVLGDVAGTTIPSEEAEAHMPEGSIEPATLTPGRGREPDAADFEMPLQLAG
jgi:hypothetical protein